MTDQVERGKTLDEKAFEELRLQHHATNLKKLEQQEDVLRQQAIPFKYWTYIVHNARDLAQPPQGAICYDRECAIDLMTPPASVRVLWRSGPSFKIRVVSGLGISLIASVVRDENDPDLKKHREYIETR